jgi:membrane fusion protein (multidrug efflux system)
MNFLLYLVITMIKVKLLPGLILLLTVLSCKKAQEHRPEMIKTLQVTLPTEKDLTLYDQFPVRIEGKINNDVRAKISGYIRQVLVDEGQHVTKGQVLFRLETNVLNQNAQAAKSGVTAANTAIDAAKAMVNAAQVEVDKLVPLVEKKIVSNVQLETAKANLTSAKSKLRQAQADYDQSRSNYKSIQENIDYSLIRSPVNGTVGRIVSRNGTLVGPTDQMPITTVSDVSEVYAYFSMNESAYFDFLQNTPGKTVKDKLKQMPEVDLVLPNGEKYQHKGKIEAVTGQVDPSSGTVLFRATFQNPEGLLSNGNSGTVLIPHPVQKALVIPENATFERQNIVFTYKVSADTVISTPIVVADRIDNLVVIKSGITKSDTIVSSTAMGLRTGSKIKAQFIPFDSIKYEIKPIF